MPGPLLVPPLHGLSDAGVPLDGGTLEAYLSGTAYATLKTIYADRDLTTPLANPLTLDDGRAVVYLEPGVYDFRLKNAAGTIIEAWTGQGSFRPITVLSKTANYTILATDGEDVLVLVDASGGAVTITLTTAVGYGGRVLRVRKIDSSTNAVTVDGAGSETINGQATQVLAAQYAGIDLISDGANWIRTSEFVTADEVSRAISISGGTLTVDLATARTFTFTLNANITTMTLQNVPSSGKVGYILLGATMDGTPRTWAWLTSTVKWPGSVAPTLSSTNAKMDWFLVWTVDGGTTWFGSTVGQLYL